MNLVIIDSNSATRDLIKNYVKKILDYKIDNIIEIADIDSVEKLYEDTKDYELVIMDSTFKDGKGRPLIGELWKKDMSKPYILTGVSASGCVEKLFNEGKYNDSERIFTLNKPFQLPPLARRIDSVIKAYEDNKSIFVNSSNKDEKETEQPEEILISNKEELLAAEGNKNILQEESTNIDNKQEIEEGDNRDVLVSDDEKDVCNNGSSLTISEDYEEEDDDDDDEETFETGGLVVGGIVFDDTENEEIEIPTKPNELLSKEIEIKKNDDEFMSKVSFPEEYEKELEIEKEKYSLNNNISTDEKTSKKTIISDDIEFNKHLSGNLQNERDEDAGLKNNEPDFMKEPVLNIYKETKEKNSNDSNNYNNNEYNSKNNKAENNITERGLLDSSDNQSEFKISPPSKRRIIPEDNEMDWDENEPPVLNLDDESINDEADSENKSNGFLAKIFKFMDNKFPKI